MIGDSYKRITSTKQIESIEKNYPRILFAEAILSEDEEKKKKYTHVYNEREGYSRNSKVLEGQFQDLTNLTNRKKFLHNQIKQFKVVGCAQNECS